ncbi:hypothetical protein F8388_008822, partial [Cannabis sativa]
MTATSQSVNLDQSSILFSPNTPQDSQNLFRNSLHLTNEALNQSSSVTSLGFVFKKGSHQVLASAMTHKPGAPYPIFAE